MRKIFNPEVEERFIANISKFSEENIKCSPVTLSLDGKQYELIHISKNGSNTLISFLNNFADMWWDGSEKQYYLMNNFAFLIVE